MDTSVAVKADTETATTYGGYGVIFGGQDTAGDTFTRDTNYWLDLVPSKPLFIDHTLETKVKTRDGRTVKLAEITDPVGTVTTVTADDVGLYIEFTIEKSNKYWAIVDAMHRTGKMGLSSGAVDHLARWDGGMIKNWPLVEWSVTMTPAEPRTANVKRIKSADDLDGEDTDREIRPTIDGTVEGVGEQVEATTSEAIAVEPEPLPEAAKAAVQVGGDTVGDIQQDPNVDAATPAAEEIAMSDELTALAEEVKALKAMLNTPVNPVEVNVPKAPAVVKTLGDTEAHALAAWYKRGDIGGVKHMVQSDGGIQIGAIKASNDTDMNITTAADGGDLVPTGHYQNIIARRNYGMLASQLGLMSIPGRGTTVNVPIDNEADGEFVSTSEVSGYDRDAPAVTKAAMTLVKYTKKVELSLELLDDEDSNLMAFLDDFVGRALAKTHNALLITEAGNGTKTVDFAATSIAAGKIESMTGNDDLDPYLDDAGSVGWIMRNSTRWALASILGEERVYDGVENAPARRGGDLLGYPVFKTSKAAAIATGVKSVFFGNWRYMGWREAPGLTVLRDPYTLAATGQIRLIYAFRTVYKVLQAQAITYGQHA